MSAAEPTASASPVYKRVLLKLSREALMGEQHFGVDPPVASRIARQVDSGDEGNSRDSALRQQLESLLDQAYGDDAVSKRDPDIELPKGVA